ncbi:MAG: hypothetical protein D6690_14430 [Nitrospirae bacterium]|nr:MAG: hypothetical protein D6690_14430 [Nitrospirota bacterium]
MRCKKFIKSGSVEIAIHVITRLFGRSTGTGMEMSTLNAKALSESRLAEIRGEWIKKRVGTTTVLGQVA